MSGTQHCARDGYIGGADLWLPDTAWDRDTGALYPQVGCTHLRCDDCTGAVRSVLGQRLAGESPQRVSGLRGDVPLSQGLRLVPDDAARTYACACMAYTAVATEPLDPEGDDWHHPALPWRCAGHPPLALPATVDGVALAADGDWDGVVAAALAGTAPSGWRPAGVLLERHPAVWLARVVAHLADGDLAEAVAARVAPHLTSSSPVVRRAAVNFYRHAPGAPGAEQLGAALTAHRDLYAGVTVPGTGTRDLADELRECVGVQLADAPRPAIVDAVKAELLAGRGTTAFVVWMGQHEPAWLADHAAQLVQLKVASAGRLQRVIATAPEAVKDRMAAALAAP